MTIALIFTFIIALILFRVFVLHLRATDLDNEKFAPLPREVKLAILKERVLETPSEKAMRNLGTFLKSEGIEVDMKSYRPLYAEQLAISKQENAIALDNELYAKEAEWMDRITPFEFDMAKKLKEERKKEEAVQIYLQGVLRYYSDKKIESALEALISELPAAAQMLDGYRNLKNLRDNSLADEAAIEKLIEARDSWRKTVLNMNGEP